MQAGVSAAPVAYLQKLKILPLLSRSVLSQAKKKIPLLLPGFESIEIADDYSGPFSDVVNILLTPVGASLHVTSWKLVRW